MPCGCSEDPQPRWFPAMRSPLQDGWRATGGDIVGQGAGSGNRLWIISDEMYSYRILCPLNDENFGSIIAHERSDHTPCVLDGHRH